MYREECVNLTRKSFSVINTKAAVQYISSWSVWIMMLGCSLM